MYDNANTTMYKSNIKSADKTKTEHITNLHKVEMFVQDI